MFVEYLFRKVKKKKTTRNQRCFITATIIVLKVKGNNIEVKEIKKIRHKKTSFRTAHVLLSCKLLLLTHYVLFVLFIKVCIFRKSLTVFLKPVIP